MNDLGEDTGLFDTVNKRYPKIWGLYETHSHQVAKYGDLYDRKILMEGIIAQAEKLSCLQVEIEQLKEASTKLEAADVADQLYWELMQTTSISGNYKNLIKEALIQAYQLGAKS